MCLLILAHDFDSRVPLVIAANRDEDHLRPTIAAHAWKENPEVVGGRDVLHGGTWLALRRGGRFAAVTNIRAGAWSPAAEERRPPAAETAAFLANVQQRSRGFLVRDFVAGSQTAGEYIDAIDRHAADYAAFHLVLGQAGGPIVHYSNAGVRRAIEPGLYGVSNAPPGEDWKKVAVARDLVADRLRRGGSALEIAGDLMEILSRSEPDQPIESQLFVRGERYGTRASSAVIVSLDQSLFVEQNFGALGVRQGHPRIFTLSGI